MKKLDALTTNEYFRWLVYEHAPHVDLERALMEFVNYCQAEDRDYKDYAAAFENSILRQEAWWLRDHPEDRPEKVSPARAAYRAAFRDWIDGGEKGEAPALHSFEHLNQRGPDA